MLTIAHSSCMPEKAADSLLLLVECRQRQSVIFSSREIEKVLFQFFVADFHGRKLGEQFIKFFHLFQAEVTFHIDVETLRV